mmetsp:Transcript_471/g.1545  ORF Transcript_471/g.1545 Transcript_471/m.1545 type:complete len:203 (-) Transcript_471:1291-1899(-)
MFKLSVDSSDETLLVPELQRCAKVDFTQSGSVIGGATRVGKQLDYSRPLNSELSTSCGQLPSARSWIIVSSTQNHALLHLSTPVGLEHSAARAVRPACARIPSCIRLSSHANLQAPLWGAARARAQGRRPSYHSPCVVKPVPTPSGLSDRRAIDAASTSSKLLVPLLPSRTVNRSTPSSSAPVEPAPERGTNVGSEGYASLR